MARFVFAGRLVREKGFDLLFPFFRSIGVGERSDVFVVFGSGALEAMFERDIGHLPYFHDATGVPEESLADFCNTKTSGVIYAGYRNFAAIASVLQESDAMVMPSRFLETFGLSALESLSFGVPVIAPNKGGLSEFIVSDEYRIPNENKIFSTLETISTLDDASRAEHRQSALAIASNFSKDRWIETLTSRVDIAGKRVLLLSDFSGKLGGIETHVKTLESVLQELGCNTHSWAKEMKTYSFLRRGFSIVFSFCNIFAFLRIRKIIREFQPEVIWCHSVLRYIGPLGLLALKNSGAKLVMTYHDLGYFTPTASSIESEKLIPANTLSGFIGAEELPWKYFPVYTIAQYWKITWLFRILKTFDIHFVPSSFMISPLASRLGSKECIQSLPHFIEQ